MWRPWNSVLGSSSEYMVLERSLVACRIEKVVEVSRVFRLDLEDPVVESGLVDQVGLVVEGFVEFHDFASHRGVDVGSGFNGFDYTCHFSGLQCCAHVHIADVHQVAQLLLRVLCNTYHDDVAVQTRPFVRSHIFAIGRKTHVTPLEKKFECLLIETVPASFRRRTNSLTSRPRFRPAPCLGGRRAWKRCRLPPTFRESRLRPARPAAHPPGHAPFQWIHPSYATSSRSWPRLPL